MLYKKRKEEIECIFTWKKVNYIIIYFHVENVKIPPLHIKPSAWQFYGTEKGRKLVVSLFLRG